MNQNEKEMTRDTILQTLYIEMIGIRGELMDINEKLDKLTEENIMTQGEVIRLHAKIDEMADYVGDIQHYAESGSIWPK